MRTLTLRISCNVLDEHHWPIRACDLTLDRVTAVRDIREGCYGFDPFGPTVGWTLDQLRDWLAYDPTGSHPEQWHEALHEGGVWEPSLPRHFWTEQDVADELLCQTDPDAYHALLHQRERERNARIQ